MSDLASHSVLGTNKEVKIHPLAVVDPKAQIDKGLASGKIKKRKGGKGNVYIMTRKN